MKFSARTYVSISPTEYGSKITVYTSVSIFCGFTDSTHIVFASCPTCSGEKSDRVLLLSYPIPDTGTAPWSEYALMIAEMYVDLSLKCSPFEFLSSKSSDTTLTDPVTAFTVLWSAALIMACAMSVTFEPETSWSLASNVFSTVLCRPTLSGSPFQNSLGLIFESILKASSISPLFSFLPVVWTDAIFLPCIIRMPRFSSVLCFISATHESVTRTVVTLFFTAIASHSSTLLFSKYASASSQADMSRLPWIFVIEFVYLDQFSI